VLDIGNYNWLINDPRMTSEMELWAGFMGTLGLLWDVWDSLRCSGAARDS